MTAQAFTDLVRAKPAGRGRWRALCPSHSDRSPSLDIREGRDGRVLLICRSHGCKPDAIVAALGLTMRDLFPDGPKPSRAALRQAEREREAGRAAERKQARAERRASDIYRRLVCVADALASRLARLPEGAEADALAPVFHLACKWLQETEDALGIGPEAPAIAHAKPLDCSPFTEPDAERVEARRVRTEAELRCYAGTGQAGPVPAPKPECEPPSPWRWVPTRPADAEIGDALCEAAPDTLDEFEALRGLAARAQTKSLRQTGLC